MKILNCQEAIPEAVRLLQVPGSVLLVPTETVYGLVCRWDDPAARARIYELKHRADTKPCAAFVPDPEHLPDEITVLPEAAKQIMEAFCPGPVTLVVPDRHGSTFGFRIPNHPFILQLLQQCGFALASTSANLSGTPAALNVPDALASIDGEPALAVDGGPLPVSSKASTVIQIFADSTWKILRPGPVSEDAIRAVTGH